MEENYFKIYGLLFILIFSLTTIILSAESPKVIKSCKIILAYVFLNLAISTIFIYSDNNIIPYSTYEKNIYSLNQNASTFTIKTNYSRNIIGSKKLYSLYVEDNKNQKKLIYIDSDKTTISFNENEQPKIVYYYRDFPTWFNVIAYPTVLLSKVDKISLIIPENSIIE